MIDENFHKFRTEKINSAKNITALSGHYKKVTKQKELALTCGIVNPISYRPDVELETSLTVPGGI